MGLQKCSPRPCLHSSHATAASRLWCHGLWVPALVIYFPTTQGAGLWEVLFIIHLPSLRWQDLVHSGAPKMAYGKQNGERQGRQERAAQRVKINTEGERHSHSSHEERLVSSCPREAHYRAEQSLRLHSAN